MATALAKQYNTTRTELHTCPIPSAQNSYHSWEPLCPTSCITSRIIGTHIYWPLYPVGEDSAAHRSLSLLSHSFQPHLKNVYSLHTYMYWLLIAWLQLILCNWLCRICRGYVACLHSYAHTTSDSSPAAVWPCSRLRFFRDISKQLLTSGAQ